MEVILIAYQKISCLGQMGHLGPRMLHPASQFWIRRKDCFTILHNERGQERHEYYIIVFFERNLVILEQNWYGVRLTLNLLSGFLLILHNKRDGEVQESFISCLVRKNPIWSNLMFSGHFLMFD